MQLLPLEHDHELTPLVHATEHINFYDLADEITQFIASISSFLVT